MISIDGQVGVPATSPRKQTRRASAQSAVLGAWAVAAMIVFVGFARSYYLKPLFHTRALPLLLHVHGLVMTAWLALIPVQVLLVSFRRLSWHRRLGVLGGALAAMLLLVGGEVVVRAAVRRAHGNTPLFWKMLVAFDGVNLLVFGALVAAALAWRGRRDIHSRLILLATLAILPPAIGRIAEYAHPAGSTIVVAVTMSTCVLGCVLADTFTHRRLHPAMGWGAAALLASTHLTHFALVSL